MQNVLDWGVGVVLWFQQFSPLLDLPFRALTSLAVEQLFLPFLAFLYWCLDRRTAARLTLLFLFGDYLKAGLKVLTDQPRPFQYDPRVQQLGQVSDAGFPSGHASNTFVVWGYLASQFRRTWLWVVAVLLVVLVSLSRIYLGLHFPHDLLGGCVLGAALLVAFLWLQPRGEKWLAQIDLTWQLVVALAVPALLVLLFHTENGVTDAATMLGTGVGLVLERRWVRFDSGGAWWRRVLRFLLGLVVLVGLWMGLRVAFSGLEPALLLRFARYALVGLWGAFGAPWVFVRLRLAEGRE